MWKRTLIRMKRTMASKATRLIFTAVLTVCAALDGTAVARAEAACGSADVSYAATAHLDSGKYTVYARFGRASQQGAATLVVRSPEGNCILSASETVSGSTWVQIANLETPSDTLTFELQSPLLEGLPGANKPLVMVVSQDDPACQVDATCYTTISGETAIVKAPDIANEHGALHILMPAPLNMLTIGKVEYYVDNALMYTTSNLEAFDERMIPYYATSISRVIEYEGGQQARIEGSVPASPVDGPSQFVYRLWRQHAGVVTLIGALVGVLVVQQLIKLIIYRIYHERRWRYAHGLLHEHIMSFQTTQERRVAAIKFAAQKTFVVVEKTVLYGLIVGVLVFGTLTFIVRFARIDGDSMLPKFADEQLVVLGLGQVSVAHVNHSVYLPVRGELVAVHPTFSTTLSDSNEHDTIVKRVIGLPGERVTVIDDKVTVYNSTHPEGFNPDQAYAVVEDENAVLDIDITLANNEIFICGDNRPISIDSRDNGAISLAQVVGTVYELPLGIK
jgi:signal peptidase I